MMQKYIFTLSCTLYFVTFPFLYITISDIFTKNRQKTKTFYLKVRLFQESDIFLQKEENINHHCMSL